MIGNDIECLDSWPIRSVERKRRFWNKVFTDQEWNWLQSQPEVQLAEICLWCAKESVYKAWHRLRPMRRFAPKKFNIQMHEPKLQGFICEVDQWKCEGKVWREDGFIHAMTWRHDIAPETLLYRFYRLNEENQEGGIIKDEYGRPWRKNRGRMLAVSKSHSAGWCAELTRSSH